MHMAEILSAGQRDTQTTCPECGGCNFEDNHIDERLYVEAAKEAEQLRFEGKIRDVVDVLSALASIQIANFIRPRWACECGAKFCD